MTMNEKKRTGLIGTWVSFTRRTNEPKLGWLRRQLKAAGIESRLAGRSFHAPILAVKAADFERAWEILDPVDELPDNDPKFYPPMVGDIINTIEETTRP